MKNNNDLMDNMREILQKRFPCGLIPRVGIEKYTGGILYSRTCANLDSLGTGISDPVRIGKKVFYRIEAVLDFIDTKMESIGNNKEVA